MIEITELNKFYGDRRAVGPLSATIEKGEVVGLLGLNGAGKTTTLRVLACDLLPTSGTVTIDGVDVVAGQEGLRSSIGYLPDRPPLYDDMAVDEFLVFTARLRGVSGAEAPRRAAEVIEATELGEFAEERIGSLSHGYRQRVGIAQAIVHRPRLVLLDEPISGLDPVQIVEMRRLVRNLRGDHTVVVSSHILPEISETCDRLLVLREGHIIATGTEQELSAKLAAVQRVTLTFRASSQDLKAKVREALESLAPVRTVEVSGSEPEDGSTTLDIAAAEDCRPELARLVVEAGGDLLELRRGARELESIFLELSGAADEDEVPS